MFQSNDLFDYLQKITDLPLVLAGPILRRTEADRVTVWLALKEACLVNLKIYATTEGQGTDLDKIVAEGQNSTIHLGQHLHLVAVTATPTKSDRLQPGHIYAYDLFFGGIEENLITATRGKNFESNLSYFSHQLPTFSLPPTDLNNLRIIHGSCRKPHGGGYDTLSCLDNLIEDSAPLANDRPHQLFLTGDQIYGDDVADPILWLTHKVSNLLLGWSEELPLTRGTVTPDQLLPGRRTAIARQEGGFTAMLENKPEKAKSHLFSFGEYAVAYLLAWSPVLMPTRFPDGQSLFKDSKQAKQWDTETLASNSFIRDLGRVRRALANIPTYTICDDHDISDDWYLNRQWCDRVLGKPLGRQVVQNGLLAYALFQAWGNTPEQFSQNRAGSKLLQAAVKWSASAGKDRVASAEIAKYLGIPSIDTKTKLPKLQQDEDVLILSRDQEALQWHYSIRSYKHEVIVVDTRTWRGYPSEDKEGTEPPMLLAPTAFNHQLLSPLEETDYLNQTDKTEIEATLVVLPTNLVTLYGLDLIQRWKLTRNQVFSTEVGDSWNFHDEAFAKLLLSLCNKRPRVIILSGDVHYSCAVRINHWFRQPARTSVLVQLTSSAIKNSELATRIIHSRLKSLVPEPKEYWLAWLEPLRLFKLPPNKLLQCLFSIFSQSPDSEQPKSPPDWQYRIEWSDRLPAKLLAWQPRQSHSPQSSSLWQKVVAVFLLSWLWRNPWLQEGKEVVGRNNISLVRFKWSSKKEDLGVIQENYWHPPWNPLLTVKSSYIVSLNFETKDSFFNE